MAKAKDRDLEVQIEELRTRKIKLKSFQKIRHMEDSQLLALTLGKKKIKINRGITILLKCIRM